MPRASSYAAAVVALAATLIGKAGLAQDLQPPRARQGYYLAVGGYGAATLIRDRGKTLGPWSGSGGALRLGQLLTPRFGLGLAIDFAGASSGTRSASLFGLSIEAQRELGYHVTLRGAVGIGVLSMSDSRSPDEPVRGSVGSGYTLSVSWDWFPRRRRLTGGIALTPVLEARFVPGDPLDAFAGILGVELTWWTGLPRNQLDLPASEAYRPE